MLLTSAWMGAMLGRAKKMPTLDKIIGKPGAPRRRGPSKPWQQQLAAWTKFTGQK